MSRPSEKHQAMELDAMKPEQSGMVDGHHNIPTVIVMAPVDGTGDSEGFDKGGVYHVESGRNQGNETGVATEAREKPSFFARFDSMFVGGKIDAKCAVALAIFFGLLFCMVGMAIGLNANAGEVAQLRSEVDGESYASTVTSPPSTRLAKRDLETFDGVLWRRMEYPHFGEHDVIAGVEYTEPTLTTTIPAMTLFINSTTTTSMTETMTSTSTSTVTLSLSSSQVTGAVVGQVYNISAPAAVTSLTNLNLTAAVALSSTVSGSMTVGTITVTTGTSSSYSSPTSSTESCGEWGDGAGPCARPYGAPNATPASVLESMTANSSAIASVLGDDGAGSGVSQMALTVTLLPSGPVNSTSSVAFTTSFTDASILDAPSDTSSSVSATVTVTVTSIVNNGTCGAIGITETLATAEPSSLSPSSTTQRRTIYITTTSLTLITMTLRASDGGALVTVTETAYWRNSSLPYNINSSSGPANTANFTVTLNSIVTPGAGNGTLHGAVAPTAFAPVSSSGSQKQVKAPKALGVNGTSGGGTGSGFYCVVMLVAIVALFG
ncbi:hypothetical protein BD289DRAFT_166236 [Coniella lustricola]|uniref:Transmembrane protein n=1 Tax=Coniella lustricola TaxID=2025994 RepID=A0A2T3AE16_9PEZI|nr:hypothetical protein BD289DRAFT_166236 [Coniella lustricola]